MKKTIFFMRSKWRDGKCSFSACKARNNSAAARPPPNVKRSWRRLRRVSLGGSSVILKEYLPIIYRIQHILPRNPVTSKLALITGWLKTIPLLVIESRDLWHHDRKLRHVVASDP